MLGGVKYQKNTDTEFDDSDNGIVDAKSTMAFSSTLSQITTLVSDGNSPVLYVREERGKRTLGMVKDMFTMKKKQESLNDPAVDGLSYDLDPVSILGLLAFEPICIKDLCYLLENGLLRDVYYTEYEDPDGLSYFARYNVLDKEINEDLATLTELENILNNLYSYNPLRFVKQREIINLKNYIVNNIKARDELIHDYFEYRPNDNGENNKLIPDSKSLIKAQRILGIPLCRTYGSQTATYEHNDLRRNNDWFEILLGGGSMVIDGTGHGDYHWQQYEIPFYNNYLVPQLNRAISSPLAKSENDQEFGFYFNENIYKPFSVKYKAELDRRTNILADDKKIFGIIFELLISGSTKTPMGEKYVHLNAQNALSEFIDRLDLTELQENIRSSLTTTKDSDKTEDKIVKELLENIIITAAADSSTLVPSSSSSSSANSSKSLYDAFDELFVYLKKLNLTISKVVLENRRPTPEEANIFGLIDSVKILLYRAYKHVCPTAKAGSAMGLNVPLYSASRHRLFNFTIADTCTAIFRWEGDWSTGEYVFHSLIKQTSGSLGDGIDFITHRTNPTPSSHNLPRGGAYLCFTDGIGEFLSIETIVEIFQGTYFNGPEAMRDTFVDAIKNGSDAGKFQASKMNNIEVKEWDPNSLGEVDDIAFVVGHIRPYYV